MVICAAPAVGPAGLAGEAGMQRPGPYLALALDVYDDVEIRRAARLAARDLPGDLFHWTNVWIWMLVRTGNQHRIGRLCVDADAADSIGVDLSDLAMYCHHLERLGRVRDLEVGEEELRMRIVTWRLWQSLSPAETSWARRERAAGREPDPAVSGFADAPESTPAGGRVIESADDGDNSGPFVSGSADETPGSSAHKTRQDKTTSSSSEDRARVREAAAALASAFGEEEGFRLRLEDRLLARLEATGAGGEEAVRAVHRLLGRLAEGWTPERNDGGVGWMLSLIGTQIEVPAGALAAASASGPVAGSDLDEYIGRFGEG